MVILRISYVLFLGFFILGTAAYLWHRTAGLSGGDTALDDSTAPIWAGEPQRDTAVPVMRQNRVFINRCYPQGGLDLLGTVMSSRQLPTVKLSDKPRNTNAYRLANNLENMLREYAAYFLEERIPIEGTTELVSGFVVNFDLETAKGFVRKFSDSCVSLGENVSEGEWQELTEERPDIYLIINSKDERTCRMMAKFMKIITSSPIFDEKVEEGHLEHPLPATKNEIEELRKQLRALASKKSKRRSVGTGDASLDESSLDFEMLGRM